MVFTCKALVVAFLFVAKKMIFLKLKAKNLGEKNANYKKAGVDINRVHVVLNIHT